MKNIKIVVAALGSLLADAAVSPPALAQTAPGNAFQRYQEMTIACALPAPNVEVARPRADAVSRACLPVQALCKPAPAVEEVGRATGAAEACHHALRPAPADSVAADSPAGDAAAERFTLPVTGIHWIPIATDFLVGRARAELVVFVKERISDKVCGSPIAKRLLVETCGALTGSDDLMSGLPGALRDDFDALPTRLHGFAIDHLKDVQPALKPAACFAIAAWDMYPVLRDDGPVGVLRALAEYPQPAACDGALTPVTRWAKVLAPVVEGVVAGTLAGQQLDGPALRATLRQLAGGAGFSDEEQTRLTAAMPAVLRLIELVGTAVRAGQVDRKVAARAATLLANVLTAAMPDPKQAPLSEALLGIADLASSRYATGLHHLLTAAEAALPSGGSAVLKALVDYGLLLASLAEAQTDQEVQSILESAAAPIGSWRDYRRGGVAGFLGGLAGLSGGVEIGVGDTVAAGAPFLPIGFELGGKAFEHSSWNLLFSVVDLGALAATRLDAKDAGGLGMTGTVREAPDVGFAAVFAPGVFAGIGLGESPFVLGIGAQYLPASRAVFSCPDASPCADTRSDPVVRAMAFLAIDLPVFPLFR